MIEYKYTDYNEYLKIQYETNLPRISWTIDKQFLRLEDIEIIKNTFQGRKCLCLGCRHDIEWYH